MNPTSEFYFADISQTALPLAVDSPSNSPDSSTVRSLRKATPYRIITITTREKESSTRAEKMIRFATILGLILLAGRGVHVSGFSPSQPRSSIFLHLSSNYRTQSPAITTPLFRTSFVRSPSVSEGSTCLAMASEEGKSSNLPFWLDIGTKGGAVFWSLVLFIVPILGYNVVTGIFGVDEIEAGKWIGVGFTAFALLAWGSTYLFRVATKDMTYVSYFLG
jgi:Protein of unknown function (DUF3007)